MQVLLLYYAPHVLEAAEALEGAVALYRHAPPVAGRAIGRVGHVADHLVAQLRPFDDIFHDALACNAGAHHDRTADVDAAPPEPGAQLAGGESLHAEYGNRDEPEEEEEQTAGQDGIEEEGSQG